MRYRNKLGRAFSEDRVGDARADNASLTDARYWSNVWTAAAHASQTINPNSRTGRPHYVFLSSALAQSEGSILEIGCGASRWLPYFDTHFGFSVTGIDYSSYGCEIASENLKASGVNGRVLELDAFGPNEHLREQFDVMFSLGVIEHFTDTVETVRAFARYVKPGGLLISVCPNMVGVVGTAQRTLNQKIYDVHVSLSLEVLTEAHRNAGLVVEMSVYFGGLDFHILNMLGVSSAWRNLVARLLMRATKISERYLPISLPQNRLFSAFLGVSAVKPSVPSVC